MLKIFVLVALILFLSTGMGVWISKTFHLNSFKYSAPIGFAALLFGLQLLYYPVQFFYLNSIWIMAISSVVFLVLFAYSALHIREIVKEYLKLDSLWIVAAFVLFCVVFSKLSISIELSDSQLYLNFITQNIHTEHINYFDFATGKIGPATDPLYIYQGFYHFGSFLCWLINVPYTLFHVGGFVENIAVCTWGLGMLYSAISTMLFIEIVGFFSIKSRWAYAAILAFVTFYFNFYYWRCGFAFYGNTYRTMFVAMLCYYMARKYWKKEQIDWVILSISIGAGLACSSSFLFISFDMVYILMAYLYCRKEGNPFKELSLIVFPIVLFALGYISYHSMTVFLILTGVVLGYYLFKDSKLFSLVINHINQLLFKYGPVLLLVIVPIALAAYSFYLCLDPWYYSNYSHYFFNHSSYDMVSDPLGIHVNGLERILVVVKWIGFILVVLKSRKDTNSFLAFFLVGSLLVFLTPLTTPAIAKLYAEYVYYRAFEILFNPFTEILYLSSFSIYLNQKKSLCIGLVSISLISCVLMHLGLFGYDAYSSYAFLLNDGKNVNSVFKISNEDYFLAVTMRDMELIPEDEQLTVVSHAEGMKTFFPNLYQMFTRKQFYDRSSRVSEEFYQMARRHYGWMESEPVDYTDACKYIRKFNVDMAIINYYENWDFDQATDSCMETVLSQGNYHVKISK